MAQDGAVGRDAVSRGLFVHDHVVRQRRPHDGPSLAALHQAAARGDGQNVQAARDDGRTDAQAQFFGHVGVDRADDVVGHGDGGELALHLGQVQFIEKALIVLLRVDVHQCRGGVGRVGADLPGQLEVDPVLAVEDPGDLRIVLRLVLLQPGQLRDVRAREQRRGVQRQRRGVDGVVIQHRSRIVPQHGVAHGFAVGVDGPQTVALGGDA